MPKAKKPTVKKLKFNSDKLAAAIIKKRTDDIISQRDAAGAMGVSQAQLYKMELGTPNISVNYFLAACNWLEIEPNFFF